MNSKGHLILSLLKSFIRIVGCILSIVFVGKHPVRSAVTLSSGLLGAEILGVLEELADKR